MFPEKVFSFHCLVGLVVWLRTAFWVVDNSPCLLSSSFQAGAVAPSELSCFLILCLSCVFTTFSLALWELVEPSPYSPHPACAQRGLVWSTFTCDAGHAAGPVVSPSPGKLSCLMALTSDFFHLDFSALSLWNSSLSYIGLPGLT